MVAGEGGEGAPRSEVGQGGDGVREGGHDLVNAEIPIGIGFEDEGGGDVVREDSDGCSV